MRDELIVLNFSGMVESFVDYVKLYGDGELQSEQGIRMCISRTLQVVGGDLSEEDAINIVTNKIRDSMNQYYDQSVDNEIKTIIESWKDMLEVFKISMRHYVFDGDIRTKHKIVLSRLMPDDSDTLELIRYVPH